MYNKDELEEEATQSSMIGSGKVDIYGSTENKNNGLENWGQQLLELNDMENTDLEELVEYLNKHTDCLWCIENGIQNCVVTELMDNCIEVYIHNREDNNTYYTFNSLYSTTEYDEEEYDNLDDLITILAEINYI